MKRATVAAVVITAVSAACGSDHFWFFDTKVTPTELCDIRPDGKFCGDEGLPAASTEMWSAERRGDERYVYVDDDVWVVDEPPEDKPESWRAQLLTVSTRDPGPCTTSSLRKINLKVTEEGLSGTLTEDVQLSGAEDCGDTPTGSTTTYSLKGKNVGVP